MVAEGILSSNQGAEEQRCRLLLLEKIVKSSLLGVLLLPIVTCLSDNRLQGEDCEDFNIPALIGLVVKCYEVARITLQTKPNPASKPNPGLKATQAEGRCFLDGIKVPTPWASGRVVESPHPLKDNYKLKETVHIPGARCLYLKFDPKCATQYDYDKLTIHAGSTVSAKKVGEYGGNLHGFGSKTVLGAGWPKDMLRVEGDTVTLAFEMRSGREHNTPDRAIWGFKVGVRMQESEQTADTLPFMVDLAMSLTVLVVQNLGVLYQGKKLSREEEECHHLLSSKLLQKCSWEKSRKSSGLLCIEEESDIPRIKLSQDQIRRLRELSGLRIPYMRPSVRRVIDPETLEEAVLSAVIKHLAIGDTLRNLSVHEAECTLEYFTITDIIMETYQKLYALLRKLQKIAELENHLEAEVEDLREKRVKVSNLFFSHYGHEEASLKDLALLCFIKDVDFDERRPAAALEELQRCLETEADQPALAGAQSLAKTSQLVQAILQRVELLLRVSIDSLLSGSARNSNSSSSCHHHATSASSSVDAMSRSLQSWPSGMSKAMLKRSMSLEVDQQSLDDSILQIPKLRLKRTIRKMTGTKSSSLYRTSRMSGTASGLSRGSSDRPPQSAVLDQLFEFIGSHPEAAVSPWRFLEAVNIRRERSVARHYALLYMKQLLVAGGGSGNSSPPPHLVNSVAGLLRAGPRLGELTCSGSLLRKVRVAYSEVTALVVQAAGRQPVACSSAIGSLCTVPYQRSEEPCLVRSGLVSLLDRLCAARADITGDDVLKAEKYQLSTIAWTGFKVLANRCMDWEEEEEGECEDSRMILGLAHQVSILLTNHLARATGCTTTPGPVDQSSAENAPLQEILLLLNSMASSRLGRDILSQPACISKLLSLLLEPRLSPRMVLTLIQLCRVALPLMSSDGFSYVELPRWKLQGNLGPMGSPVDDHVAEEVGKDPPSVKIVRLLFAKLADFLIPGAHIAAVTTTATAASHLVKPEQVAEPDGSANHGLAGGAVEEDTVLPQGLPDMDRMLSLFIHKREDQPANEVIQQLLNASADMRLFQPSSVPNAAAGTSQNLDKIVSIDRDLTKAHRAEILTDDATVILRRAVKLAQQGFIVSIGTPQRLDELSEEKRMAVEQVARDRNAHLAKFDPARPFISSNVANSMAHELIELIHSLFGASTASTWESAIHGVIGQGLSDLQEISAASETLFTGSNCELFNIYNQGRQTLAVLTALGAYEVSLKPGLQVRISGLGMDESLATIVSISELTGQAVVRLCVPTDVSHFPRPANELQVPLSRLEIIRKSDPVQLFLSLSDEIIEAVQTLLIPDPTGTDPLTMALPAQGEGRSLKLATGRLVAEIRSRALQVLALFLQEPEFACRFMQKSCQAVDMLKCLSKDCLPSDRQVVVESATSRLRNLYRDCVKPPAPPSRRIGARHKVMVWDPSKTFPPLKSVLFTHNMLGITYYTEPVLGSGIPRGLMVYSNQMIPPSVNHFYWEVDILSLGDSADESGAPLISIGLAPLAEKKDNAWSNPIGTVFFHNNGRVVHYNGSSLLQWRSLRFDVQLNPGDTLGIGWEKLFDASANIPSSGTVYFTLNGVKLDQALEEVSGNMYPVVHIQKKNTRVKANFGSSKFAYSDGRVLQAAAAMSHQSEGNDTNEGFGSMPFQSDSDSSGSNSPDRGYALGAGHRRINTYSCRTALTPKALKEYVIGSSEDFRTGLSNEICAKTGPHIQCITLLDEDSDTDDEDEDGDFEDEIEHREDVNSLLVKAWETKVFPIIRRRFRNEAERKDGLEQIKGALSLGMADIARQTVEFLYEENGGIPRDLHLPTLDDVKAEMAKFSVDKLKRGQQVKIADQGNDGPHKKYFIPSMQKTFGLVGEVLEIDATYELIQVETYLKAEGLLVRFWYPVNVLEKPSECTVKRAVTGVQVVNINSAQVHKELLSWEFASTRIFCRKAYVQLIEQSRQAELPTYNLVEENSSMKTMISSNMLLLRDIDIENLQHLSNHLLATPFNGNMLECNINIADHQHVLNLENAKLSSLFYHDSDSLAYDLAEFLNRAASKGEDYVTELTTQICIALQLAPEFFCTEEILINDISTLKSCVQFPGVAFVAASVKVGKSVQDMKDLKDLTIQLQTLDGCFIKYNGQISSKDIVQYPKETNGFKDPLYSAFTPVVMATDKVRVSHSGGEEIGIKLYLHGIPQQFPVAALYIEQILLTVLSQEKSKLITSGILHQILEILSGLLMHYDMPQIIKERTFLLLAELLSCYDEKVRQQKQETHLPHLSVFTQMHGELKTLYEYETSRKCFRRFSTYLQALFELCTAITDLTGMQMTPSAKKSRSPTPSSASDREGSPAPTSVRRRFRPSGRRNRTPSAGSSSPLPESQPVSAAVTPEKHWFTKANLLANSMKFLVKRSQTMSGQTHDFFRDCYHNQSSPNDHSRLIILKGIPKHLEAKQIKSIITKALAPHGGLFKDDIFLQPTLDLEEEPPGEEGQETVTSGRKRTTSFIEPVRPSNSGLAVIQVRTMHKLDDAKMELERTPVLTQPGELDAADEFGTPGGLHIHKVTPSLHADDAALDSTLELYLKNKLFHQNCLRTEVLNGLEDLFISCYIASQRCCELEESDSSMESGITLKQSDVLLQDEGNLLYTFFYGIKQTRRGLVEGVKEIFQQYGSKLEHNTFKEINRYDNQTEFSDKTDSNSDTSIVSRVLQASREATDTLETPEHSSLPALRRPSAEGDECSLTLEGFLKFIDEYALQNIRAVWTGLQACGFDLQMERTYPMDWIQQQSLSSSWTMEMDEALVELGNSMGRQWQLSPLKITPGELYLTESQLASHEFRALQGLAPENLRSRYAVLVQLNQGLSSNLLALTDFRSALCYPGSIAAAISKGRRLLFYDMKECFLRKALDDTHQRNPDQPPPEVLIDPVEEIGNKNEDVCRCLFSQALNQLAGVPSEALNVSVAIGGDPQFPFNIKMAAGDEVHGNSGSFRHFLSGIVEQLHGPTLNLLVPYRGPGPFTGRYFLKPGPMNYGEEKMLQFLGQLLGISLRAAIPLPLDLMPSFWRSLVGQPLLAWDDQATAMDPVTAGYLTALEDVPTAEAFEAWLEEAGWPKLTYASLAGSYVELCQGGMSTPLTWDNRREYAERVRELRLREWEARERVTHIRAGLGTVAPLALILHTFSPEDLELRLCGQPYVDLKFLRSHTIYQVGISESDQHVGYFWSALESFSQEELGKFIKFACNQDRIPMVGDREWQQVPPYPMKIAPADRRECPADSQLIRVETCMFMIKLPRYTTYETMRARLLYAISCALDPLSG